MATDLIGPKAFCRFEPQPCRAGAGEKGLRPLAVCRWRYVEPWLLRLRPVPPGFQADGTGADMRQAGGLMLARGVSFWFLAVLLGLFLFAASAPSPLYSIYAKLWQFSSTTLTAIYAVYAAGALGALLVTGRLSDHVGRRPIVLFALLIQGGGMVAFIAADGVGSLYLGRVLQGTATGIASGAISAWLVDLEPEDRPRLGSLLTGIALLAGLGSGAFVSSLLVQYAADPLRFVYWLLVSAYTVCFSIKPDGGFLANVRRYWQPTFVIDATQAVVDGRVYDGYLVGHPCFSGMSGGPVFDEEGNVRGMAVATLTRTEPELNGNSTVVKNGIVLDCEHIRALIEQNRAGRP
jgi:MFS family permease